MSVSSSASRKDWSRMLPGLAVSLVSLVVVFSLADFNTFIDALRLANYRLFPYAIAVFLLSILARTFAWRTLLEERVAVGRVFVTLNEGYLLNNLLPFRLGEVGRGLLLSRTSDLSFWQVISTILVERAFDVILVVGILLGTLPFVIGADWALPVATSLGGVVLSALVVLHLLARNREWAMNAFLSLQSRLPILRHVPVMTLDRFFQGLIALTSFSRFSKALAWMIVAWFLLVLEYYLILLSFIPEARILWAAFGISVVGLGVAVPSSPGGVGVVQAAIVGIFRLFDVDPSVALAYSITVHVVYLSLTTGMGIAGLMWDGESLTEIYHSLREKTRNLKKGNL